MTKHLFFTNYAEAIYMMKEFGVKFTDLNELGEWHVAPESEHIFEGSNPSPSTRFSDSQSL